MIVGSDGFVRELSPNGSWVICGGGVVARGPWGLGFRVFCLWLRNTTYGYQHSSRQPWTIKPYTVRRIVLWRLYLFTPSFHFHPSIYLSIHPSIQACMHACMHACLRPSVRKSVRPSVLHSFIHALEKGLGATLDVPFRWKQTGSSIPISAGAAQLNLPLVAFLLEIWGAALSFVLRVWDLACRVQGCGFRI